MSKALITESYLTNIANAIRSKTGKSATLTPAQMAPEINSISIGTDVSDTTAAAANVLTGKYFYTSSGVKTQGTIATYNGAHHTSGYTVTVTLQTSYGAELFNSAEIYQLNSTTHTDEYGFYDDLTLLGSFTSPNGSTTVIVSEDAVCIYITFSTSGMDVGAGIVTTTGGVTEIQLDHPPYPYGDMNTTFYTVASNGTILIPNIDWDDD